MRTVLFVGAGSFIGQVLLGRIAKTYFDECDAGGEPTSIFVIIQRGSATRQDAQLRSIRKVANLSGPSQHTNLHFVEGDISQENLGFGKSLCTTLQQRVTYIVNAANAAELELPIAEAAEVGDTASKNVLAFAKTCQRLKAVAQCTAAYLKATNAPRDEANNSPASPLSVSATYKQLTKSCGNTEQVLSWFATTRLPVKCSYTRFLHPVTMPTSQLRSRRGRGNEMMLLAIVLATLTVDSLKSIEPSVMSAALTHSPLLMAF